MTRVSSKVPVVEVLDGTVRARAVRVGPENERTSSKRASRVDGLKRASLSSQRPETTGPRRFFSRVFHACAIYISLSLSLSRCNAFWKATRLDSSDPKPDICWRVLRKQFKRVVEARRARGQLHSTSQACGRSASSSHRKSMPTFRRERPGENVKRENRWRRGAHWRYIRESERERERERANSARVARARGASSFRERERERERGRDDAKSPQRDLETTCASPKERERPPPLLALAHARERGVCVRDQV